MSDPVPNGADPSGAVVQQVYEELRRLADVCFLGQHPGHTLEPTALVNEAYVRLAHRADFHDRTHFVAVAVTAMRQILVDHARRRAAQKRGGGWRRITLSDVAASDPDRELDVLDVEQALASLAQLDERKARVVELRFYGGLTIDEIAALLDVSPITVNRDWWMARAWLQRELKQADRT
jgi:RNA polymerase sigma factor (TIGR02999 family)